MDSNLEPVGLFEHRLQTARSFRARNLDPILGAVREPLSRVREIVKAAPRQSDLHKRVANVHRAANSTPAVPDFTRDDLEMKPVVITRPGECA